jgi:hypothetical protein
LTLRLRRNMKLTAYYIVFLCLLSEGFAQNHYDPERIFDPNELRADFAVLQKVLREVHIGLYRYSSKEAMDSLFASSYQDINRPMTEVEFFRIINRCVVAIRDEHTFALPSAGYWHTQLGQVTYDGHAPDGKLRLFPFFIKIIDHRLFIDNNLSRDLTLTRGTEILEINGIPAGQVLNILLPTIHTNGFIETFRYRNLEQFSLHQTYNRFIVHYALFIGTPETFRLKIRRINRQGAEDVTVAATAAREMFNNYWRRYSTINDLKKRRENPLEFSTLSGQTAYLRISDLHNGVWSNYNYSYSTEFRTMFEVIDRTGIRNLIIDLRGNEGGNFGIGVELLKYILAEPFRPYDHHEVNDYRFPGLTKYFRDTTALRSYPDKLFIPQKDGTFWSDPSYETESWSRAIEPVQNPYCRKLYVLIDGATGSAASILATVISVNRAEAIFVGEEAGGDMAGPISGEGTDIVLPNTKIRVDIPFIRRVVNLNNYKNNQGRGLMPDYHVTPTSGDLINNDDTALKFTLSLIANGK